LSIFQNISIADKALKCRFALRINFLKPDAKSRQSIWKSKIPGMPDRNAAVLCEKFEITGGEIEIKGKQAILKKVLDNKVDLFDTLVESCNKNHGFSSRKRIGF